MAFRSPIDRPTPHDLGKRLCRNVKARLGGADDQGIMGASARGEAALATVASAVEALLLSEGRIERLDELVAIVGAAVEVDRAFVFQNVRSPDGRLWMDLVGEWDADGVRQIFEDPGNHLHPYAPDFSRRIDVYGKGEPIVGLVSDLPEPERTVLAAEDVVSVASVPILVGIGMVGLPGVRRLLRGTGLWTRWTWRRSVDHGSGPGHDAPARPGRGDASVQRGSVPLDGGGRPGGRLHRRSGRGRLVHLHQPPDRARARLHAPTSGTTTPTCGARCCTPTTARGPSPRTNATTKPAIRS